MLYYLPAAFVALERVQADRHWASDVTLGALIGTFVANWAWDAHFADVHGDRRTVYPAERRIASRWKTDVFDGRLVFVIEFGF